MFRKWICASVNNSADITHPQVFFFFLRELKRIRILNASWSHRGEICSLCSFGLLCKRQPTSLLKPFHCLLIAKSQNGGVDVILGWWGFCSQRNLLSHDAGWHEEFAAQEAVRSENNLLGCRKHIWGVKGWMILTRKFEVLFKPFQKYLFFFCSKSITQRKFWSFWAITKNRNKSFWNESLHFLSLKSH